jgi:hypothetical protein
MTKLSGTIPLMIGMNQSRNELVRKDTWETIQYYTKTYIQVKEQHFYSCSAFHSHSRVFHNEQNLYPKMSVKRPLAWTWVYISSHRWESIRKIIDTGKEL